MFKTIVTNAIKIVIILLIGWGLVCLYQEKIYYKPEAVTNRIEKASEREYTEKLSEAENLKGNSDTVVIIDASCGGNDNGIQIADICEKDITLAVAKEAKTLLEKQGITVFLTRDGDFGLSERQRIKLRDTVGADYCVRLVVLQSDDDESGVLTKYSSTYYSNQLTNADFAAILEQNICDRVQNNACGAIDVAGEEQWLEDERVPCAIVSVGYISDEKERQALNNSAYQKKLAEGLEKAILACME